MPLLPAQGDSREEHEEPTGEGNEEHRAGERTNDGGWSERAAVDD